MASRPDACSEFPAEYLRGPPGFLEKACRRQFPELPRPGGRTGRIMCSDMGYNAIELLPVMEHPLDDSWGYQVTGYFSVTSRFGTPADFKYSWSTICTSWASGSSSTGCRPIFRAMPTAWPVSTARRLYEYADTAAGRTSGMGDTMSSIISKKEVCSFLISNAWFWLQEFHVDGLRVDAVSSMLYLNYGRTEYLPNIQGGMENLEAIDLPAAH